MMQWQGLTSIWNGQKLKYICKHDNIDEARNEFENILRVWEHNGTGGMLECRFHEKRPTSALNNKSDYAGSFTFTLNEWNSGARGAAMQQQQPVQQQGSSITNLLNDIVALEKIKQILNPGGNMGAIGNEDPEPKQWWQELLTTPLVEELVIGAAKKYLGFDMDGANYNAEMAGDNDMQTAVLSMQEIDRDRLDVVIARLAVDEKDILGLLEKLADLKEKKPRQYAMAKTFL
jgi:hypothetical protein